MAKKKKSKEAKSNFGYSVELTGLVLILIGLIGFGFGFIGNLFKEFAIFLAGTWWFLVLISLILIGFYMLFKRKMPEFFTTKLIGFYILVFVILSASHFPFIEHDVLSGEPAPTASSIFTNTYDEYLKRTSTIIPNDPTNSGNTNIVIGGGFTGALGVTVTYTLVGNIGSTIILTILSIFGLVLAFDINMSILFEKIVNMIKRLFSKKEKEVTNEEEKVIELDDNGDLDVEEEKIKEPERVVITSIDQIKSKPAPSLVNETLENKTIEFDKIEPGTNVYKLPKIEILNPVKLPKKNLNTNETRANKEVLERVIKDFGIVATVVKMNVGPAVTQYEITVPHGVKVSRISSINKEIALAMAAKDVRIEAPIPGKSTIGIEIPNGTVSAVGFREVLEETSEINADGKIYVALGKDIMGKAILEDLTKMPHLLVAGSTGSGKSVCINAMINSILMRYKPNEVKLVMVDPKKVELTNYNGLPHLLCPVVSDPKKASITLQKIVSEMEKRYELFSEKQFKNIAAYNEWVSKENKRKPEYPIERMPYIIVIIDELADLMLVASKEVEDSIMRITQMARAAGIHLIVATQRPSTDVITGLIKNNIPSRIAFSVSSGIDSRTILDMTGAEKLLGRGDMLYLPMGENTPKRIQGCYISDEEIERLINHCAKQIKVQYDEDLMNASSNSSSGSANSEGGDDPLYDEVVAFAVEAGKVSASLLQRRFKVGYNRAARIVDILESRGICGPANGSKPRDVLVKLESNE